MLFEVKRNENVTIKELGVRGSRDTRLGLISENVTHEIKLQMILA